jgi:hypothetical protein
LLTSLEHLLEQRVSHWQQMIGGSLSHDLNISSGQMHRY